MALGTYAELQTAVLSWLDRSGIDDTAAPDWITLGEAFLNREIGAVETDATLTGTADSRRIDISSLSMERPIALFLAESGYDEVRLQPKADGTFPYRTTSGRPTCWAIDGTNIDMDCPLLEAYPFRFRYRQRFALSDSATTNWLLTNHPDVYLAATMVYGNLYNKAVANASTWREIINTSVPSITHSIAQSKRGTIAVEPAFRSRGGVMTLAEWTNG